RPCGLQAARRWTACPAGSTRIAKRSRVPSETRMPRSGCGAPAKSSRRSRGAQVTIRVAGSQIPVTLDVPGNLAAILRSIEAAADGGADILLTPEGSLSGYTHTFDQAAVEHALQEVRSFARKRRLGLALGTCFIESDGRCYDQLRFYGPDGSYLGFHSKTLTCGTLGVPSRGEIEHFSVAPLRTFTIKGIPCGGLVCNDMWANPGYTPMPDPHLSQKLSEAGA